MGLEKVFRGFPDSNTVVVLPLTAGQQVWVKPGDLDSMYGASASEGMYSWFSAHLEHAI